jgi:ABC-type phosphate transport system permease subunit
LQSFLGFMVDLLSGTPSIVMGLFGFTMILTLRKTVLPKARTGLFLAVSHSLRQTRRLADRLLVLRNGQIVQAMHKQHLEDYEMFQKLIEAAF